MVEKYERAYCNINLLDSEEESREICGFPDVKVGDRFPFDFGGGERGYLIHKIIDTDYTVRTQTETDDTEISTQTREIILKE